MRKHDLVYQRIKLESQAEYIASEAGRAMCADDVHQLHLELLSCLADVVEAINLLETREVK